MDLAILGNPWFTDTRRDPACPVSGADDSSLWMRRRNSKAWQTLFMSMGLQEELSPQCHQAAVAAAEHQAAVAAAEQMDSAEKEANDEDLSGI